MTLLMTLLGPCTLPGRNATRVDVRFTAFSLKLGALPALSLPLDLFSPTGAQSIPFFLVRALLFSPCGYSWGSWPQSN